MAKPVGRERGMKGPVRARRRKGASCKNDAAKISEEQWHCIQNDATQRWRRRISPDPGKNAVGQRRRRRISPDSGKNGPAHRIEEATDLARSGNNSTSQKRRRRISPAPTKHGTAVCRGSSPWRGTGYDDVDGVLVSPPSLAEVFSVASFFLRERRTGT